MSSIELDGFEDLENILQNMTVNNSSTSTSNVTDSTIQVATENTNVSVADNSNSVDLTDTKNAIVVNSTIKPKETTADQL